MIMRAWTVVIEILVSSRILGVRNSGVLTPVAGSGGINLLDPTVFKGAGVSRIGIAVGKAGKIYILNADNLGGYKLGPGQTDLVIQTIDTALPVFGGSGSYPGEGGYFYSTPVGYPTYAYKLGFDGSGKPQFTQAGKTNEASAGRVGVGIPTITTLNGQAGTAILWMAVSEHPYSGTAEPCLAIMP